jgi:hypothetical protein
MLAGISSPELTRWRALWEIRNDEARELQRKQKEAAKPKGGAKRRARRHR